MNRTLIWWCVSMWVSRKICFVNRKLRVLMVLRFLILLGLITYAFFKIWCIITNTKYHFLQWLIGSSTNQKQIDLVCFREAIFLSDIFAYFCILLHTFHTFAYFCILLHTFVLNFAHCCPGLRSLSSWYTIQSVC